MNMRSVVTTIVLLAGQFPLWGRADVLVAAFSADVIQRYDGVSGALVGTFASHATMDGPAAMVYNPAGHLLVLNEFSHNVLRFNGTTGAFIDEFISPGALGGAGVADPDDMEIGADGNLYLASHFSAGGNIWKFSGSTGAFLGVFASAGGPTHHTHGLTFGPGGDLFQGDLDAHSVLRFNGTTGALLGTFATSPSLSPGDLVFGPGTLYATNGVGGGAQRFTLTGTPLAPLIASGPSTWGLLIDGSTLYVGEISPPGRIQKFDATTGTYLGDFTTGVAGAFDMLVLSTAAVPEAGAAIMLTVPVLIAAAIMTVKNGRKS